MKNLKLSSVYRSPEAVTVMYDCGASILASSSDLNLGANGTAGEDLTIDSELVL